MKFNNQSVIVTGGSSGIGRATAVEFAKQGASVVVADVNVDGGQETVDMITSDGARASFIKTDTSNLSDVQKMIEFCMTQNESLDHIINNAGVGLGFDFFHNISDDHWHKTIAINQTGVFYCMREALKIMKLQNKGTIVNTASAAGTGSAPRMGAYCASKHAVVGMTKTAATEYGKYGIRVNAVCPTVIITPMGAGYLGDHEEMEKIMLQSVPMKRFGQPEEVAKTICWLCSEDASYLNGVALPVDGGSTA